MVTSRGRYIILFMIIGISTFLFLLGNAEVPLFDPDEPVYAETAKEMINYHSYLSPMIYHHYWYDKPIMFYWVVLTSFKLFGVSGWSARFGSVVFALLTLIFTYLLSRKLTSKDSIALLSVAMLSTSLEFFIIAKASITDMTLLFFLTASLYFFSIGRLNLFYIFMGLAVLTKGPVGIVIAGGTAFLFLWSKYGFKEAIRRIDVARGVLWMLVVAAPWYVYMIVVHGDAFIDTFIGYHNITRFLKPEHREGAKFYYYIPVLLLGTFPWTGFVVQLFVYGKRLWREDRLLLINVLWVFAFFTLSQTRLPSYILPLFPALFVLMAKYFYISVREGRFFRWSSIIPAVIITIGIYAIYRVMVRENLDYTGALLVLAISSAVFFICHFWSLLRERYKTAVYILYAFGVYVLVFLMIVVFPVVGKYASTRAFASDIKRLVGSNTVFIIQELHVPSVIFYTDRVGKHLENFNALLEAIDRYKKEGYKIVILMRKSEYEKLVRLRKDIKAVRFAGRKVLVVVR